MTVHIDVETAGGMQRKQNRGSNDALDLLSANKAADSQVRNEPVPFHSTGFSARALLRYGGMFGGEAEGRSPAPLHPARARQPLAAHGYPKRQPR